MRNNGRLIIALVIVAVTLVSYCSSSEVNEITGEKQYVALSTEDEVALGLQAVPELTSQYGGKTSDPQKQVMVDAIGHKLLQGETLATTKYKFNFHVLADPSTVNAFALPGGQVFITEGLLNKLRNADQIAGVLAHEITHVIGRHGAEQLAKQQLAGGLASATGVAAGDYSSAQIAAMVGQMVNMKYGRDDELESDALGVRFMEEAGYDPNAMVEVMKILQQSANSGEVPEFFSSHPNPENRIEKIKEVIRNRNNGTENN